MSNQAPFAVYLSHSWRPEDVPLNLQVWDALAPECELLADAPAEPGSDPPYFINRIEELLRRADLFISILTFRAGPNPEFTGSDNMLRCSPYSLFEIRLAEQLDLPRLVLYERATNFRAPAGRPWECYIPFNRGIGYSRIEDRQWNQLVSERLRRWIEWLRRRRLPRSYEQSGISVVLTNGETDFFQIVESCLHAEGFTVRALNPRITTSGASFRELRSAALGIMDFTGPCPEHAQIYSAAHAIGLPFVRLSADGPETAFPWVLQGYPGGYQHDIVRWSSLDELASHLTPRIQAMLRVSPAMRGEEARSYLQSKRYTRFSVFLSHTLKPPSRELVNRIFELLRARHVPVFEYHQTNASGIDWRESLSEALSATTHFVVLLSEGYEQSPTCTFELEEILRRRGEVKVFPFMVGGRSIPHPKLGEMHHVLVEGHQPSDNAQRIANHLVDALDHPS